MHPLPLLVPLLLASPLLQAPNEETLLRAKKLLMETKEESCRQGTDLCVGVDDVAAVELLLDVLRLSYDRGGFLPSAHYRDVVWDGLRRMVSAPARGRVLLELEENKKDPWMRQWCAELLGEYGDASPARGLVTALGDKEPGVRLAAARALGRLELGAESGPKSPRVQTLGALQKLSGDKDPYLRAAALESCARLDPAAFLPAYHAGLKDKDAGVRCALLGVVRSLDPDGAEGAAIAALKDADWRPRLQAVEILGEIHSAVAVQALIGALDDARPVVQAGALRILQELSGEKHTKKAAWEAWWKEKGEAFDPSRGRGQRAADSDETRGVSFNGIVFESDHTAFLIDISKDMTGTLNSQKCTKAEAAARELEATFARLQGRLAFSLFVYAREITPFSKKGPVDLTAKTQEKALAFVRSQRLQDSKNIWQALETVLQDPTIDTVFLLSSGEPEIGLYVHWNRITWHLREINRFRKVVVHAIAYSDSKWYRDQLEKIAEATGGEFRWFE